MTDREAFAAALAAAPTDIAGRLVYADMLDEGGTTDFDAAQAEYIRLSCTSGIKDGNKVRRGIKEGRWLGENWTRLVPHLAPLKPEIRERTGGLIEGTVCYEKYLAGVGPTRAIRRQLSLHFSLGFVTAVRLQTVQAFYSSGVLLAADHPHAERIWECALVHPLLGATNGGGQVVRREVGPLFDIMLERLEEWDATLMVLSDGRLTDRRGHGHAVLSSLARWAAAQYLARHPLRTCYQNRDDEWVAVAVPCELTDILWLGEGNRWL